MASPRKCPTCKRPFPSAERLRKARERAAKWYKKNRQAKKDTQ